MTLILNLVTCSCWATVEPLVLSLPTVPTGLLLSVRRVERADRYFRRQCYVEIKPNLCDVMLNFKYFSLKSDKVNAVQLQAVDHSARRSMKNVAKYDRRRELQDTRSLVLRTHIAVMVSNTVTTPV